MEQTHAVTERFGGIKVKDELHGSQMHGLDKENNDVDGLWPASYP